jgi:hypothetical protein
MFDLEQTSRRRQLKTPTAAGEYLGGVARATLAKWRVYGRGPEFVKVGRFVFYEESALDAFLDQNRRRSTSEKGES